MSNFKRDFIQDFLADYPDKEVLKDFINKLPLSDFDKKYLVMKYCGEKVTPHKVMAYNLSLSQRYVSTLQENIITRAIPYINMFFIKALDTSPQEQT
jgi:hypothetical protein